MFRTAIDGLVEGGSGSRVSTAIQLAAARTGVDFTYLLNQARVESSFNPNARARTSSATGLYQFVEQTWLATVERHGAEHGLGWAAAAIDRGRDGRYRVSDPAARRAILDLRRQPEAASAMAAEFAADNRAYLERRLGRSAEPVDLYLAHFLGASGAARFLEAHDANPNGAAATLLPAAARANRSVFFGRDGSPRSFAQIREHFAARIGGSSAPSAPAPQVTEPTAVRYVSLKSMPDRSLTHPTPEYARLAYLMLAELGA